MVGRGRTSIATKVIITAPALVAHDERLAVIASLPSSSDVSAAAIGDCRKGVSQVVRKDQPVARPEVAGERNDPATNRVVRLSRINDRGAELGLQIRDGSITVARDHVEAAATPNLIVEAFLEGREAAFRNETCGLFRLGEGVIDVSGRDEFGVDGAAICEGINLVDTVRGSLRNLPGRDYVGEGQGEDEVEEAHG